jgi:uncharacterized protein YprB with RNaseH-like and TPR domain
VITRENQISINIPVNEYCLKLDKVNEILNDSLFFDLEHYVYKKPICIGVFGCCHYDRNNSVLVITQYMIENKSDSIKILNMSKDYFDRMYFEFGKRNIITFSGNNDFTMLNYLFEKNKLEPNYKSHFTHIDLQKEYEKVTGKCIGLKSLEKSFGITRQYDTVSGSNLAKTFKKIMQDKDYIRRMPQEKTQRVILYNEADVINLFHICANWYKHIDIIGLNTGD